MLNFKIFVNQNETFRLRETVELDDVLNINFIAILSAEVKRSFHKWSQFFHPDKLGAEVPEIVEMFKKKNAAYDMLCSHSQKERYIQLKQQHGENYAVQNVQSTETTSINENVIKEEVERLLLASDYCLMLQISYNASQEAIDAAISATSKFVEHIKVAESARDTLNRRLQRAMRIFAHRLRACKYSFYNLTIIYLIV